MGIRVNDDVDDSQCHFTLLLAKRKDVHPLAKLPVVLVLHYTSSSCEHEEMVAVKARFARCGFLAVGLDTRYLGCRAAPGSKLKADYLASLVRAWKQNQPHRPEGSIFPFIYGSCSDSDSPFCEGATTITNRFPCEPIFPFYNNFGQEQIQSETCTPWPTT